jgi:hypothetical protein
LTEFVQVPQIAVVTAQSAKRSQPTGGTTTAMMTMMIRMKTGEIHYRQTLKRDKR